jgi:hypothetical protein
MYAHAKKFHQSIPSLTHLIYEELVCGYQLFDTLTVVNELLLSVCEDATFMILCK